MALPARVVAPLRWARHNGWKPVRVKNRRVHIYEWIDAEGRLSVILNADSGGVQVRQHMAGPADEGVWTVIAEVWAGCWQQVHNTLTIHGILPARFNTAYVEGVRAAASFTVTAEKIRQLEQTDLLTWLAAIQYSLQNGSRISGAVLALDFLCEAADISQEALVFDPAWTGSQRTDELIMGRQAGQE